MFEIALYAPVEFLPYYKSIAKKLATSDFQLSTTIQKSEKQSILFIATTIQEYDKMQKILKIYLSEAIVKYYKEKTIKEHMKLVFVDDRYFEAFLKAMILYEMEEDIAHVCSKLHIAKTIYIDSLYWFTLRDIREKWVSLINMINDNMYEYITSESFLELLRYLITMGKRKQDKVSVVYHKKGFLILDEKNNHIQFVLDETDLICILISINPRRISLSCMEHLTESSFQVINYLFHGQVEYLV